MGNSTHAGIRAKTGQKRVILTGFCLLMAAFCSNCILFDQDLKDSKINTDEAVPAKNNTQAGSKTKVQAQASPNKKKTTASRMTSATASDKKGGKKAVTTREKTQADKKQTINSLLGKLTAQEKNVLSWLIGGVLGLAALMLIIKGIISRGR